MSLRLGAAFWAKAIATVAILTIVLLRVDLSAAAATLSHVKVPLFLLAVGLAFPLGFTGVQRWRCVATTFGEDLPLSKAFMYAWIGQFINLGLPTVLGMDSVRAWKMHKQGVSIGLAARIVIVDRLCSLVTLLIVIALGLPHLSTLHGSEIFKHSAAIGVCLGKRRIGWNFCHSAEWAHHSCHEPNEASLPAFQGFQSRAVWQCGGNDQDGAVEQLQSSSSRRHRALLGACPRHLAIADRCGRARALGPADCDGADFACRVGRERGRLYPGLQPGRDCREPGPGAIATLWARRIDNRPARWRSLVRRAAAAKPIGRALFDLTSRPSEESLHELLVVSDMRERRKTVADRAGKEGKAIACVRPPAAGLERGFESSEILGPNLRGGSVGMPGCENVREKMAACDQETHLERARSRRSRVRSFP